MLAKVNRPSISKLEAGQTVLAVHHLDLYAKVIDEDWRGARAGRLTGVMVYAINKEGCNLRNCVSR